MTVRDTPVPPRAAAPPSAEGTTRSPGHLAPPEDVVVAGGEGSCTVIERGISPRAYRENTSGPGGTAVVVRRSDKGWWEHIMDDDNRVLYLSAAALAVAIPTLYFALRKKAEVYQHSVTINAPSARVVTFFTDLDKYFDAFSSPDVQYTVMDQTRVGTITRFKLRHALPSGKEVITHGKRKYTKRDDGATVFEDDLPIEGLKGKAAFAIKPSPKNPSETVLELVWTSERRSYATWFSSSFSTKPLEDRLRTIKTAAEAEHGAWSSANIH